MVSEEEVACTNRSMPLRAQQSERQSSGMAVHSFFEGRLSFLSLNHDFDGYPDTGESGDAYNIEASIER